MLVTLYLNDNIPIICKVIFTSFYKSYVKQLSEIYVCPVSSE